MTDRNAASSDRSAGAAGTSGSRRILIVRLSAIGDTIHTIPLAAAIKRAFPDCHLGWLVEKPASPLVVGNPLVDWSHVLAKGWLKSPGSIREARSILRRQKFDTVIDVQGLTKSAVAAWLSGARQRIGFTRGEAREMAPLLDNRLVSPTGRHAVDITLSLLSALGLHAPDEPEYAFPDCPAGDKKRIDAFLEKKGIRDSFILMGPWASSLSKCWPIELFAQLAGRLARATGMPSLVLGHGLAERDAVAAAAETEEAMILAPDVSVLGVIELQRRAALFVGSDSFPIHSASGLGRPTIGLFGVTNPARLGPRGPCCRSVYGTLTLVRSRRAREKLDQDCMAGLRVETVESACLEALECARRG